MVSTGSEGTKMAGRGDETRLENCGGSYEKDIRYVGVKNEILADPSSTIIGNNKRIVSKIKKKTVGILKEMKIRSYKIRTVYIFLRFCPCLTLIKTSDNLKSTNITNFLI